MKYRDCIKNVAPYVPGKSEDDIKNEYNLKNVVKIASNENPYGATPNISKYLKNIELNIYPDNDVKELRKNLANELEIEEECLLFGNGSVEIIQMLSRLFLDKDDNIVTQLPSFSSYFSEAKIQDSMIKTVKYNENYSFNLNELLKLVDERTKLIYLTNPNNPLGTILSKEKLLDFVSKVPKDILIVIDEAYYEFVRDENYISGLDIFKNNNNVCILRTFSKAYGLAALRIGYIVANKEVISNLEKVRVPFNVSTLSQKCALIALQDKEYMKESVKKIHNTIDYIYEQLDNLKIKYIKTQANFIMINVGSKSDKIVQKLMEKGFIVRGGFPLMDDWIRVSISTLENMIEFIKVLEGVLK